MSVNIPIVESVVGGLVALSAFYCAFSCCCLFRYLCRSNGGNVARTELSITPAVNGDQELCRNDTLRRKIIDQFINSISRGKKPSYMQNKGTQPKKISPCPICFEDYCDNPSDILIGLLKQCGHYFHFDCIWKWLEQKRTCPLCRNNVNLTEEDIRGISLDTIISNKILVSVCIENEKKEKYLGDANKAFDNQLETYTTDSFPDVVHYDASAGNVREFQHADERRRQMIPAISAQVASVSGLEPCRVCGSKFRGDPAAVIVGFLSDCGHYFHFDCIYSHVAAHRKCPTCDVPLRPDVPIFFALLKDVSRSSHAEHQPHALAPDAVAGVHTQPAINTGVWHIPHDSDIYTHL